MFYPRIFYLFYYAASASLLPFLVLYYQEIGLTGRQIGVLAGVMPLTMFVGAPLWGELADVTQRTRRLLLLAIAGSFVPVALITQFSTFPWVLLAVLLLALTIAPVMPFADNAVLEALGDRQHEYGKQRFWGAVGWGVSAPLVGALTERAGIEWAFYAYLALMAGGLLVATRLPIPVRIEGRAWGAGLATFFGDTGRLAFLAAAFLGGMALSITHTFLLLHLSDLGADRTVIGLALTAATLSEFPVFLLAGRFLARFPASALLVLALLVFSLRLFAYSFVTEPAVILALQLLHGPSYALMWVAGIALAKQLAPVGTGNTAQGLFSAAVMGLGAATGGFVGGGLYEAVGAAGMFRWIGLGLLVGVALLLPRARKGST